MSKNGTSLKSTTYTADYPSFGTVPIGSHKMHYESCGHGPEVILCLSGGTGTAHVDFSPQLEYFGVQNESRYTVIVAVNALGYGLHVPTSQEKLPILQTRPFLEDRCNQCTQVDEEADL